MRKSNAIILTLSIIAALIAGSYTVFLDVSEPDSNFTPTGDPSVSISAPKNLAAFYSQKPIWKNCEENTKARCGNIQVPLNWDKPSEGAINISVAINPAKNPESAPYLLMNPGGPGASGRDWVTQYISSFGTANLRNTYNVVGFDPRGIGKSTPIKCYGTSKLKTFLYSSSPYESGSAKDIEYYKKGIKDFGAACLKNTGALLGNVDTSSAAKDMDIIRAVLGSKKLNYIGYSYGTLLGATYATYFPTKVGRFVLDGVVDPTVTPSQDSLNQLTGFQSAMRAYLADCIKSTSNCPFKGLTVDQAMNKVGSDYLAVLEKGSIPTTLAGRELTLNSGFTGMIAALYSKDSWQYLTQAFRDFFKTKDRDGRVFLLLADMYFGFDGDTDSFAGNENEAFKAVTCLDSRESAKPADMDAQNKRALKLSPVFGKYWLNGGLACYNWPFDVKPLPKDYSAKTAPKMMIVGTTNDPATPYSQAEHFAHKVLANGWLLTYKGEGHTAYGSSNSCVANTVDDFLINGNIPTKEKTC